MSASALDKLLFGAHLSIAPWGWEYIYQYGVWVGLITAGMVILTGAAAHSYNVTDMKRRLLREFLLFKPSNELLPEDFGYQQLNLGEEPNPRYRPYHQIYIQRNFASHDDIAEDSDRTIYTEDEVRLELSKGRDILLLGQPLQGKTRSLYEILKRTDGYIVLSPYKNRDVPDDDLFSTLKGCRVVILLDDLNGYVNARIDLHEFFQKLDRYAEFWVIAGTCRTGPEMSLLSDLSGNWLAKFNESPPLKLSPLPLNSTEMARLGAATNQKWTPDLDEHGGEIFPTPGIVTMSFSMGAMRQRFGRLPPEQKDLLRALQLLFMGLQSFQVDLIKTVLKEVLGREIATFNDCLDALGEQAFLRRPARQDPVNPELAYIVGAVDYLEGKVFENDLLSLMNILISRRDAKGLFRLGLSYSLGVGDHESALKCFNASLKFNAEDYYVLLEKGGSLEKLGRIEEAIEAFSQASTIKPNEYYIWARRGLAYYRLHQYEEALTDISRALDCGDDEVQAEAVLWSLKATSLNHLGRYTEALEAAEKSTSLRPDQSSYWAEKGAILHNLHLIQEAVDTYRKSLELNPNDHQTIMFAVFALGELQRWQEIVDLLDKSLHVNPEDPDTWEVKGKSLFNMHRYEEALEALDQSLALRPDERSVWRVKAMIYTNLNRYEEALAAFDRALGLGGQAHLPLPIRESTEAAPITPISRRGRTD